MEYGGYLPLELNKGHEFFERYKEILFQRYNSGRACVIAALNSENVNKVFIPYYNCHVVEETLQKNGYLFQKYLLDENFLPVISDFGENDWIIYVDYFGLDNQENKRKVVERYNRVIIDNTQSFYAEPVIGKSVFNVYSCRKFFGVSDGAYLVYSKSIVMAAANYDLDSSWQRVTHLLKSIECGTNAAYQESLINEDAIGFSVKKMSPLTQRILRSIDYERIRKLRVNNFRILCKELENLNVLKVDNRNIAVAPMVYPLVVESDKLREKLVQHKIYVPQWWKYLIDELDSKTMEVKLSRYLCPLPIDQRYSEKEMYDLVDIIKTLL